FSMVSPMASPLSLRWWFERRVGVGEGRSDAAARLGDAGDLGGHLGGALREELVELLDAHARGLAEDPDGRARALLEVLGPHELEDLPVVGRQLVDAGLLGELDGDLGVPLLGLGEEALVVDV